QRHGVRIDPAQVAKTYARSRHQVVNDPNVSLGDDAEVEVQQVVVIFVYRPRQRILDRNDRRVGFAFLQGLEDFFEALKRNHFGALSEQLLHRFLAESPQFALESDPYLFRQFLHRLVKPRDWDDLDVLETEQN